MLKGSVSLRSDMTLRECSEYLGSINLNRIEIPAICNAEIVRLRGRVS
jgi:hypothetical protein